MNRRERFWLVIVFVAAALLAGCHGDPNVRKQKYLESGERFSAQGKYREAVIQFLNAVKIDKNFEAAHYDLAQAYVHLGEFGEAHRELERTVDLQPADYKARIDLGNLEAAGNDIAGAQAQVNAVAAAQPNNPDVHALLSAIALKRGQNDQALIEISRALELDPNRATFHENLAILEADDSTKTASVEEELKKSITLDPKSVSARLLLAGFYAKNGRWSEAEEASRDAIAADAKSLAARQTLAQVFLREGNQEKSEEVLRQAAQDLADNPLGVQLLADYYERSGQNDKARAEYASLAAKYPRNLPLQEAYVRALDETKDYSTAQTVVAGLMKKNGKDPQVLALNGIVLLNNGRASDAVDALERAASDYPKDVFVQYWLGKAALAKGDSGEAEKCFQRVTELNPTELDAMEQLALIASERSDMNLLADVGNKAIAAAPRFPGGYVWRAITEINSNSADKAEADLETAISIAPQSPQAYLEFGRLRFAQKRFQEGVTQLEQALLYDPNSVVALRMLVSYDVFNKQPAKALARVNAQIARSPKNSGFYDLLARLQIQNKNLGQAAATAQQAIKLNSSDGEAVMLFAQIEIQRGQAADAIRVWEQWSNAHPNDAGVFAILGIFEESRGDQPKAEAYYRKSLGIQPQQPIAANNLAYRMLENGENVDIALTLAQAARQGMPNSPVTADTLAWAYYHKGTYGFARDLLEDAIKTEPDDAVLQYHLGMVYAKLQEKSEATIHLKKAVTLAPASPTAKDAEAALHGLG